jgi:hypothetical protein
MWRGGVGAAHLLPALSSAREDKGTANLLQHFLGDRAGGPLKPGFGLSGFLSGGKLPLGLGLGSDFRNRTKPFRYALGPNLLRMRAGRTGRSPIRYGDLSSDNVSSAVTGLRSCL